MTSSRRSNLTLAALAALVAVPLMAEEHAATGTDATEEVAQDQMAAEATSDTEADPHEGRTPDIEAGGDYYKKNCRACHGPTAKGVSAYPRLVGQTVEELTGKLERYRAGEKIGPNTMLMAPRAKDLTDQDIANITHWIASLEE